MAVTWNDLINEALQDLGVIRPGETVSSTVQADCFLRLQQLISNLSTEGALLYTSTLQTFSVSAAASSFTLGAGGTWATNSSLRAQKVTAWKAVNVAGTFTSGGAALSFDQFDAAAQAIGISFTNASSQVLSALAPFFIAPTLAISQANVPAILGADTAYPLINVRIYPPPAVNNLIEVAYWTPITPPAAVGDTVTILTPGWEMMLESNLAMALLPRYGRQGYDASALAAKAASSKAAIIQQNTVLTTSEKAGAAQ